MSKPIVAVVGRPNVGKSTLFNRLAGERISIVEDTPGVTRDRIYADVDWLHHDFTLIDTGGMDPENDDFIVKRIFEQAQIAIETADVIMFVVDGQQGLIDADVEVANVLRRSKKPIVLVVNKVDNMRDNPTDFYEFYNMSLGEPIPVSAGQALGLGELLDRVVSHFDDILTSEEDDETIKVAIIGKPNVGKSSLINKIIGEERTIVSDVPGTTRDAIDTPFMYEGRKMILIDTAGIRRKSKIKESIERFSIIRSVAAIERSDVCVLVIDVNEGVTEQDARIAGIAYEKGKACVIVVNKWDTIEKDTKTMNKYLKDLEKDLSYLAFAPKVFISALTGQRINKLLETVVVVSENHALRVQTGILNDVLIDALAMNQPHAVKGKQLRIYYMTQATVKPPTFVLFVNKRELMHFSYRRYIENQLREAFGFSGTPIHFIVREKNEDK